MKGRREFLILGGTISSSLLIRPFSICGSEEQEFTFKPEQALIPAPTDAQRWVSFRESLHRWREEQKKSLSYNGSLYER